MYFERSESDDYEDNREGECEEWMHLANLCANNNELPSENTECNNAEYWQSHRQNYSEEQIGFMA